MNNEIRRLQFRVLLCQLALAVFFGVAVGKATGNMDWFSAAFLGALIFAPKDR